jgi:hypothetical protein
MIVYWGGVKLPFFVIIRGSIYYLFVTFCLETKSNPKIQEPKMLPPSCLRTLAFGSGLRSVTIKFHFIIKGKLEV